jgi:hypothetical protein
VNALDILLEKTSEMAYSGVGFNDGFLCAMKRTDFVNIRVNLTVLFNAFWGFHCDVARVGRFKGDVWLTVMLMFG